MILLFQVVGVLAGLVVGILLLGFAIQFCRERGSASEKVKTGFCENNLQYFFNVPQDSQKVEENVAENVNGTKTSFVFLNFSKSPTR